MSCDSYGCWFAGQGTCGCRTCSDCLAESAEMLELVDAETNHYRCAACATEKREAADG